MTGRKYTFSFDAELDGFIGGPVTLNTSIAEFDSAGVFTGTQHGLPHRCQ
jgi:hypothetical protein